MKTKKKAFTLMELLVVMLVTMIVLVLLIGLLSKTIKVYNEVSSRESTHGYTILLISDVETLSRGCDYALTVNENRVLQIFANGEIYSVDSNDYGIDAVFNVDNEKQLIKIICGGEEYCVNYIQNLQQ